MTPCFSPTSRAAATAIGKPLAQKATPPAEGKDAARRRFANVAFYESNDVLNAEQNGRVKSLKVYRPKSIWPQRSPTQTP